MTSDLFGTPKMIVPYEWNFECVEEEPAATIASKMILFRGEKVFRVGLKNHVQSPILFFMAINLRKIGLKVEDVKYGYQNIDTITKMTKHDLGDEGNLQLFTTTFLKKIVKTRRFVFRICIVGADSSYSYQLSDRLAKDQLWAALKSQPNLADVAFKVKDKTFDAHKSILAARSQVFADEFEKKWVKEVLHPLIQIKTGVQPSTFVNFLHFIYTGEPMGTLADEELLKLADHYQLKILSSLCQHALKKTDAMQMAKVSNYLNSNPEELYSSKIMPEEETEIFFDRTTTTFRCPWLLKKSENGQTTCVMQYLNENIFTAYFTEKKEIDSQSKQEGISKPVIHFTCVKHRTFGLKVEDIYCGMQESGTRGYIRWFKMEPKHHQNNAELLNFTIQALSGFSEGNLQFRVYFHIKTTSMIGNYYYEMMDESWSTDFWLAATNRKLTDVEIFVGTVKVMEAHRVILSARSPVLNIVLNKINKMEAHRVILSARSPVLNEFLYKTSHTGKSIVTFKAEFDVEVVENFLNFLYTGSLKTTDGGHQLSILATMYQVETLKNVCELINRVPGVEELSDSLIQLESPAELP